MKKLVILTGAAVIGIIMAAVLILHHQSGADDFFKENVRVLAWSHGPADPAGVVIPCKFLEDHICVYSLFGRGPEGELIHLRDRFEANMIYTNSGAN